MKAITQVKKWNAKKRVEGQYMLVYTLGNGSMTDEPRQKGYVVHDGARSRYFPNYTKAKEYAKTF